MTRVARFEQIVLPHLDAAFNLARWLTRNDSDAQDVVQESFIRALRYFDRLKGTEARPWLLGIVRNTCFSMLQRSRQAVQTVEFDEAEFDAALVEAEPAHADPFVQLQRRRMRGQIDAAIRALSPPLREVIVLRELEELDYAQIAAIAAVPIGTVMSRLSRAREKLRAALTRTHSGPTP